MNRIEALRKAVGKVINPVYETLFPHYFDKLKKELHGYSTVLDLGCGYKSPIQYCNVPFSVGVDLHDPYLKIAKEKGIHSEYIKADILELELAPKSFDAVIALGVIEHMTKEDGYKLITKMETLGSKKIIIITSNGYLFQDGYDGNPLQEHKSGWSTEEFRDQGFRVYGEKGWKALRGYRGLLKYRPQFLWEVISGITQYITYFYPQLAHMLFAVKDTSPGIKRDG